MGMSTKPALPSVASPNGCKEIQNITILKDMNIATCTSYSRKKSVINFCQHSKGHHIPMQSLSGKFFVKIGENISLGESFYVHVHVLCIYTVHNIMFSILHLMIIHVTIQLTSATALALSISS